MSDSLKLGKLPWKAQEASAEEFKASPILGALTRLIGNAKLMKDSSSASSTDFTDSLWELIKNCESATELSNCLKMVYDEMRAGGFRVLVGLLYGACSRSENIRNSFR